MTHFPPSRRAFVVAGMHRCGTSALAKAMSLTGAALPRDPILAGLGNALGHWEPRPIVDLNDAIFAHFDASWSAPEHFLAASRSHLSLDRFLDPARRIVRQQFADASTIVLKDPRVSLLPRFWEDVLTAEGFVVHWIVMVRRPDDVAASLAARDGISAARTRRLWTYYMASVDIMTEDRSRVFCAYDDLIDHSRRSLERIYGALDLPLPSAQSMDDAIASLDATHRHHDTAAATSPPSERGSYYVASSLRDVTDRLWLHFLDLSQDRPSSGDLSRRALHAIDDFPPYDTRFPRLHATRSIMVRIFRTVHRLILGGELERSRARETISRRIGRRSNH